jgi:hypothetical protein
MHHFLLVLKEHKYGHFDDENENENALTLFLLEKFNYFFNYFSFIYYNFKKKNK